MVNIGEQLQVYKCSVCGNVVMALYVGGSELFCCGKPMNLLEEKQQDQGKEKHVPVIEKTEKGFKVKVGSVEHPMEENHYIVFIELIADGESYIKFLKPGMKPEAEFYIDAEKVTARDYCNLHGLWKNEA